MTPAGPQRHVCADCGKQITNEPRVTIVGLPSRGEKTRVVCRPCFEKIDQQQPST